MVKWSLFALILVVVVRKIRDLWDPAVLETVAARPGWLVAGAAAYVAGWIPSIWFWRTLLARLGGNVPVVDATRAYYCGHLGKYIPGKALVLVIRAGLVKGRGAQPMAAALTAAYETLAMMAIGAALGVALAPSVLPVAFWRNAPSTIGWLWDQAWFRTAWTSPLVLPTIVAVIVGALLPFVARVATLAANKMVPDELDPDEHTPVARDEAHDAPNTQRGAIGTGLFATGMLVLMAAWWIHGLSLGCIVTAVSGEGFDFARWPAWTAAVSLATSLGFVAIFAPGGLGVREWVYLLILPLQPGTTPEAAAAAAVLLRLVWLVTELVVAAILYWGAAPRRTTG